MKNKFKWSLLAAVAMAATVAMAADKYISSSGNVVIKTATSKSVNLQDTLYTTQAGNVGVGTSSPAGKFDVNSLLTVLSNGNVGVGTITPAVKFDVKPTGIPTADITTGSQMVGIRLSDGLADVNTKVGVWANLGSLQSGMVMGRHPSGWGTFVAFHTHPLATSGLDNLTERMRIDSEGRVGIGTTDPLSTLHVAGSTRLVGANGMAILYSGSSTSSSGISPIADNGGITIGTDSGLPVGNVAFKVRTWNSGYVDRLTILGGGAVYMSSLSGGGTVTSSAGTLTVSSDASLKRELPRKLPGLTEVLELRPAAYQWKTGVKKLGKRAPVEFGFMANEVAKIIPEAAPKGPNGLYGLHDRAIIVAAVNAIKEQQKVIELQKAWICEQANAPEELCKGN